MRSTAILLACLLAACDDGAPPPAAPSPMAAPGPSSAAPAPTPEPPPPAKLDARQAKLLADWYAGVGERRGREGFGELIVRAARLQLGKPYLDPPAAPGPERLEVRLDTFQCVSLVESTLALARCVWLATADEECFLREVEASRYRDGKLGAFSSKLHYYSEWLSDNARRGRLRELTAALGGRSGKHPFFFVTRHAERYAPLTDASELAAMADLEARLSAHEVAVIDTPKVARMQRRLESGDVIAVVGSKPGLLVSHTGFVADDAAGVPHLLHASSYHGKVLLTGSDLAGYLTRRADRIGLMVARPLAPAPLASAQR